jgi:hypothetical protein
MAFEQETKAALRILEGIEEATMSSADSLALVEDADPALLYLIFTWLRGHYGPSHAASDAVLGRVVALTNHASVAKKIKEGQADPVVEWFEESYSYKEFNAHDFIALVIEKLEG